MAYPTVSAPYGFKPVNLIGGQVYAGSTRSLPIQYGYATNIFFGDVVSIVRGFISRIAVTTGADTTTGGTGESQIGVFMGCSFTNPVTKQKTFSQFWPAGTLAGDAVAIVTDDPDIILKSAVVTAQGGSTIGSAATAFIGQNINGSDLAGSINTGDSYNGVVASTVANTAAFPLRIVDIVRDTAIPLGTATYSSGTTSLTTSAIPNALPVGTEVGFIAANGQYVGTGSYVSSAASAGATTVAINSQYATVNASGAASTAATIPASSTLVFTQYPEVLVKFNFGIHSYYANTGFATTK